MTNSISPALELARRMVKNRHLGAVFALSYLLAISTIVIAGVGLRDVASRLVVHWGALGKLDVFGTPGDVWGITIFGVFLTILSTLLAGACYDRSRTLSYIVAYMNAWVNVLLLVAVSAIVSVN